MGITWHKCLIRAWAGNFRERGPDRKTAPRSDPKSHKWVVSVRRNSVYPPNVAGEAGQCHGIGTQNFNGMTSRRKLCGHLSCGQAGPVAEEDSHDRLLFQRQLADEAVFKGMWLLLGEISRSQPPPQSGHCSNLRQGLVRR